MDAQRALLDELMGRNRDGDKPNEDIRDYRDRRVCKRYLCGLCPNDLFQNTKMDMGECEQWHLPKLRDQYEMERLNVDYGYEQELERELRGYQGEVEKKIARAQKRLEEQDGAKAPSLMDVENTKEVLEITAEIQEAMQKAEDAGNEGEVDESMELMSKVEALQQKKAEIQASAMLRSVRPAVAASQASNPGDISAPNPNMMPGSEGNQLLKDNPFASTTVNQKLRVCDVCGAFLSIFDSDRRLADHFGGKLHLGYLQIRKKLEEIAEIRRERRRRSREKDGEEKKEEPSEQLPPSDSRSRSRQQKSSSRRSRSREKSRNRRSRSRSREKSRRRDWSRSRDRHSRRHRSRSSSRSRRR